eukprot:TRINITY_DN995_c0_g1_i2.p1 TRINITY_DN995_c0_g1~~TRINITY_DN995_c0_g1_i2.p1  ORF type:complete len:265 (-),score=56.03 TRINITY_DN995_c0_g1_i2:169-963(-)
MDSEWLPIRDSKLCPSSNFDCHFELFSSCAFQEESFDVEDIAEFDMKKLVHQNERVVMLGSTSSAGPQIPSEYKVKYPDEWYWAQLVHFITRPNQLALSTLQKMKKKLGIEKETKFITLVLSKKTLTNLEKVIEQLQSLQEDIRVTKVFVSYDHQDVLDELQKYPKIEWISISRENTFTGGSFMNVLNDLVQFWIASEGSGLIGYFLNDMTRLIYEKMIALKGFSVPVVAMDTPYFTPAEDPKLNQRAQAKVVSLPHKQILCVS